ncbi:hypothetical protein BS78_01G167000 [Paspalum vaginatum]|nr:hypothetical protein BS78_01G167000 [Paspalum vaginatum]
MAPANTILLAVAAAVAICVVAVPTTAVSGDGEGWYPFPVIDAPKVIKLGKWAVAEHDKKAHDKLKFSRVVSGEEREDPELGMKYHMIIHASDRDGNDGKYEAVLAEQVWLDRIMLISFNPAS